MRPPVPAELQPILDKHCEHIVAAFEVAQLSIPLAPHQLADFKEQWHRCLVSSEYIAKICQHHPQLVHDLWQSNAIWQSYEPNTYEKKVSALGKGTHIHLTEAEFEQQLRLLRQQEMLRIAWRDICGLSDLAETLRDLSAFADACIHHAVNFCYQQLQQKYGTPKNAQGISQPFFVIALGKLGSEELNFSSDIDLMFAYPEPGMTEHDSCSIANEMFFTKLAQSFIKILKRVTAEGFVFRVDMRLRPFGSSGPLATHFKFLENYYLEHGRDWERFAFAKARIISADSNPAEYVSQLQTIIRQFVYRRYVDFSIIDSLRHIKDTMKRDSQYAETNIKRGPGGIREAEFIAHVFQLVRGGKSPEFQVTSIFHLLTIIAQNHLIPEPEVKQITDAYGFLRLVEHRLQQFQDKQTQVLPSDETSQAILAYSLDFKSWEAFFSALNAARQLISQHFLATITPEKPKALSHLAMEDYQRALNKMPMDIQQALQLLIDEFKQRFAYGKTQPSNKQKLLLLFNIIIPIVLTHENPKQLFKKFLLIAEVILRRSAYLALLIENPNACYQLIRLLDASQWILNLLTQYPFLLDELINSKTLYKPYTNDDFREKLRQLVISFPLDDLEQQMDSLRQFKHTQILRMVASDISETMPLMKVSDHLTNMANALIDFAIRISWQNLTNTVGYPMLDGESIKRESFAVIAYGKLGGFELSYGSDLDLVFVYDIEKLHGETDGPTPIANATFFTRLAQRVISFLSVNTTFGKLYEVDTRLRPMGNAGLLVCSLERYLNYQQQQAWTWEHQALTRARVVIGSKQMREQFTQTRLAVLAKPRQLHSLADEVIAMRQKMRQQQPTTATGLFHLEHDAGGIKDIEFLVQFLLLAHSHEYPEICFYPDNIRQLDSLAKVGILSHQQAQTLSEAYVSFRNNKHRHDLQNQQALVDNALFSTLREEVINIWQEKLAH